MKIHQVKWTCSTPKILYFNRLSCFNCASQCSHFHETLINYDTNGDGSVAVQSICLPAVSTATIVEDHQLLVQDMVFEDKQLQEGDWVVVQFSLEKMQGKKKWIGVIRRINENETFMVEFVRSQRSKYHSGFLYSFPNIKDVDPCVCKSQILYSILPPTFFQRKMKFTVHCDKL